MDEVIHKQVNDLPDSMEIGTPSKGGAVKIYCNFSDEEGTKLKIEKAFKARKILQEKANDV
tara:strand:+ start:1311 stop:1493 length:183 start_codon:yes stop_codon:yes gene_type:complete